MAGLGESPVAAAAAPPPVHPVAWPEGGVVPVAWCVSLAATFLAQSSAPAADLSRVLPAEVLQSLLDAGLAVLDADETLVTLTPRAEAAVVTVVGDKHGQLHDVARLFDLAGWPSPENLFIFNGDFVDRRVRARAWAPINMRAADPCARS